jgi:hypothetical protein
MKSTVFCVVKPCILRRIRRFGRSMASKYRIEEEAKQSSACPLLLLVS